MKLSDEARQMRYYRANPSKWVKAHFDINFAKYRGIDEFKEWASSLPDDSHAWARKRFESGQLTLDNRRSYQAEALDRMAEPGFYAFKWCNGAAKTATAALAVHWFLTNYPGGRVVTTAGTWSQIREQLWREIEVWSGRAIGPIAASADRMGATSINLDADWFAFGRAAKDEATFEGVHGDYIMVLMDEAKAIRSDIYNAVRRILRGNPGGKFWWVCLSSPGSPTGIFYDICRGSQSYRWNIFELSAYESERIGLDMIGEDAKDLGEDSPLFISMVCGEFPDEGEDTIIPLSWVMSAVNRDVSKWEKERMTWRTGGGLDIARFGSDETVFSSMFGPIAKIEDAYAGKGERKDLMSTAGKAKLFSRKVNILGLDDSGLGGGVVDRLKEEGVINIKPLNPGYKPKETDKFYNLGAEMAWALRMVFKDAHENSSAGITIESDKKLIHQLASRKFDYMSDGRIRIESKQDMKKRGEKSPDRADSLTMANWSRGLNNFLDMELLRSNAEAVNSGGLGSMVRNMIF